MTLIGQAVKIGYEPRYPRQMGFKILIASFLAIITTLVAVTSFILISRDSEASNDDEVTVSETENPPEHEDCKDELGEFYRSLNEVDARLGATIPFEGMRSRLGDALSAEKNAEPVGGTCYDTIYLPLFKTLVDFQTGTVEWANCLNRRERNCETSADVRGNFEKASKRLAIVRQRWTAL